MLAGSDPYELLFLKKAVGLESHKGGEPVRRGDDAEVCIISWLKTESVPLDLNACARAATFPKE